MKLFIVLITLVLFVFSPFGCASSLDSLAISYDNSDSVDYVFVLYKINHPELASPDTVVVPRCSFTAHPGHNVHRIELELDVGLNVFTGCFFSVDGSRSRFADPASLFSEMFIPHPRSFVIMYIHKINPALEKTIK